MKTFACALVLLVSVAAFAGQSGLSPGYYICESWGGSTSYFSDIFLGPGDADSVSKAFAQMLAAKYGYTERVDCPIAYKTPEGLKRLQDQHKPYAAQRAKQGRKIVETGWTYNGAPSLSVAGYGPSEPTGGQLLPNSGVWCYAVTPDNTIYYTQTKPYAANIDPNNINVAFGDYIASKYGVRGSPGCSAAHDIPNRTQWETSRQATMDKIRRSGKPLKFIEVDWTPTARLLSSGVPPATGEVPSAPKASPQSAYEQALAAQRPKSVTQEQLAAAAKKPAPAPYPNRTSAPATTLQPSVTTTADLYQFCSSTGSPYRGTAQSHFYVTQVFPASTANLHPEGVFGVYLRKQHPQESNSASCTQPGALGMLENTRRTNIEYSRKNFPERAVVELNWKPAN